jgi:formylglycine-generating enzyme required for sulfatase activity
MKGEKVFEQRLRENDNGMHEVGLKQANSFGLFDMLGNVWELVSDWYDENYYQHSPAQDPTGPSSGEERVTRGGSHLDFPSGNRVSTRVKIDATNATSGIGFRCARGAN